MVEVFESFCFTIEGVNFWVICACFQSSTDRQRLQELNTPRALGTSRCLVCGRSLWSKGLEDGHAMACLKKKTLMSTRAAHSSKTVRSLWFRSIVPILWHVTYIYIYIYTHTHTHISVLCTFLLERRTSWTILILLQQVISYQRFEHLWITLASGPIDPCRPSVEFGAASPCVKHVCTSR